MANEDNVLQQLPSSGRVAVPATRRTFLQGLAGAGAAVSLCSEAAWARVGEIGYWAKDLTNEQLIAMHTTIQRIRWFERTCVDKMLTEPNYRGYNHFYVGQEAVATGVCAALKNSGGVMEADLVYSTHRPSGHAIAKGVDVKKMAAEYDFRATGLNNGYAGEMHISDKSVGFIGADGMIGPGPVIATGSAFAIPRPRQQAGGGKFRRRRYLRDTALPQRHEQRGAAEAAVHLRDREQSLSPVRPLFLFLSDEGHRHRRQHLRHSGRRRRRTGRAAGLQCREGQRWSGRAPAKARR